MGKDSSWRRLRHPKDTPPTGFKGKDGRKAFRRRRNSSSVGELLHARFAERMCLRAAIVSMQETAIVKTSFFAALVISTTHCEASFCNVHSANYLLPVTFKL